jgi:hypothetical protein
MNFDEYIKNREDIPTTNGKTPKPSPDWMPGVEMKSGKGSITTKAIPQGNPNWNEWIDFWLGDGASKNFYVREDEPVNFRTWQGWGKEGIQNLYYFKANLYARKDMGYEDKDLKKLVSNAKRKKPADQRKSKNKKAFVICMSDWQVGKEGTENMLDRYYDGLDRIAEQIKFLKRKHKDLDKLIIAGLGDLVESCSGHYPMQTFTTVLDERQQKTLARQMLLDAFNRFSKDFNEVLGLCALGNHGEKRLGTKAYTTFGDNKDGELFDEVAQVLAADPSKKHVKFTIPGNSLAYSLEVLPGTVLTLAHGHQAKRGTTPAARVENWFNKMASKQSKGGFYATNVLLVGHYHHHWSKENERLLLGTTTIDDGSQWFEEGGGDKSLPGITTLVLHSKKDLRKWSDIEIL